MTGLEFLMAARAFVGERSTSRAVDLEIGRRIVNHEVVGGESPEDPFIGGEAVYAHTTISGHGAGFVEHVWSRNGAEVARHYMPIGDCGTPEGFRTSRDELGRAKPALPHAIRRGRRWRVWSRHRLSPGEYAVEVLSPEGKRLARKTFTAFVDRVGERGLRPREPFAGGVEPSQGSTVKERKPR